MRKCLLFLLVLAFTNKSFADCTYSDLIHNPDGTVTYSKADHLCVGNLIQDDKNKTAQVNDLNKAITLKDLALQKSDDRAQLWMDTSLKLEKTVQEENKLQKDNQWLYFALGVLTVGLAEVGANQLRGK